MESHDSGTWDARKNPEKFHMDRIARYYMDGFRIRVRIIAMEVRWDDAFGIRPPSPGKEE